MATGEGAHVLTSAPDTDIPKEPKVTQDVQVSEDCMCPLMGKLRPKRKSLGIAKEQQLPAHPAGHLRATLRGVMCGATARSKANRKHQEW